MNAVAPLIYSSVSIAILVMAVVLFGAIVQAGLGMGFGLTAAPLLALIDPALVPGATLYLGMFTALFGVIREPQSIVWSEVRIGVLGRMVGVTIGAAILYVLTDTKTFMLIFGILVGLAVLLSAFGWKLKFTTGNLLAMSCISGTMGIITSVGAPPMALVYANRSPQSARPTMAAFFAAGCALSLVGLYLSGWGHARDFWLALMMVPAVVVGTFIARKIGNRFEKRYQPLLLGIAGLAALMLIVRGLT